MREELFDVSGVGAVVGDGETRRMVSSCVRVKQLFLRLRQLGLGSGSSVYCGLHISRGISFVQTFRALKYFSNYLGFFRS